MEKETIKQESGGWRDKVYKIADIPVALMEFTAALLFMIYALFFIYYGYEDFLMNRSRTALAGCLLAILILQFLMGETILHRYMAINWKGFIFEVAGWMLGTLFIAYFVEVDTDAIPEITGIDNSIPEYIAMALFLIWLFYLSVYSFCLFSKYGKKGFLHFLMMLIWEIFVFVGCAFFGGETNMPLLVTVLLLPAASFLAASVRYLAVGWIGKKRKIGKKQIWLKRAVMVVLAGGILFGGPEDLPEITPRQDEEGYYLLCTREGFDWFIHRINKKNERHNVNARLTADIVLNDTSDWERWEEEPPEYQYRCMVYYSGHFDGNGHTLEGYYSEWDMPIFNRLEEQALVTDLKIRKSLFQSTYEGNHYDDDGEINVVSASALCFANYGRIEGCDVEATVLGDWSAGGIVSCNYGVMENCSFAGRVEAGKTFCEDRGDDRWAINTICAGGICRTNVGSIRNCVNEGTILCETITDTYYMDYAVGGIVGKVNSGGSVENCKNVGNIQGPQLSGGIAGANNRGEISQCANIGEVCVKQPGLDYVTYLITAGICASNGGLVDSCWNTGKVFSEQEFLSYCAPVYGIACNLVNPEEGQTKNCYYLPKNARQVYRQSGVYKLSEAEMAEVEKYVAAGQETAGAEKYTAGHNTEEAEEPAVTGQEMAEGEKNIPDSYVISDVDSFELFTEMPDYPGTDEDDYIHLHMGPKQDTVYEVQPGDTLWKIAESFYGDGIYYDNLVCSKDSTGDFSDSSLIFPGEKILVPGFDYYLLCANDEEGFDWSFCQDASGEKCPTTYFMAKPEDWYYGCIHFAASRGLEVLWPKDKELGHGTAAGDIRILYYMDSNPDGDFLAGEWGSAKEKIAKSAEIYCGRGIENLRFYRYELDNEESLYGYSFRLYPDQCPFESELRTGEDAQVSGQDEALNCAVFYRLREGLIVEFIGIEPVSEDMDVLARTRYLAARVVDGPAIEEKEYTGEEFYGREDWPYTKLHNPFAVALEYSPEIECDDYILFTGAQ